MITRTFQVAQIHCANCENTIKTALFKLAGVRVVVPSTAADNIKVSFDDTKVSEGQVRDRLEAVGFSPLG